MNIQEVICECTGGNILNIKEEVDGTSQICRGYYVNKQGAK